MYAFKEGLKTNFNQILLADDTFCEIQQLPFNLPENCKVKVCFRNVKRYYNVYASQCIVNTKKYTLGDVFQCPSVGVRVRYRHVACTIIF